MYPRQHIDLAPMRIFNSHKKPAGGPPLRQCCELLHAQPAHTIVLGKSKIVLVWNVAHPHRHVIYMYKCGFQIFPCRCAECPFMGWCCDNWNVQQLFAIVYIAQRTACQGGVPMRPLQHADLAPMLVSFAPMLVCMRVHHWASVAKWHMCNQHLTLCIYSSASSLPMWSSNASIAACWVCTNVGFFFLMQIRTALAIVATLRNEKYATNIYHCCLHREEFLNVVFKKRSHIDELHFHTYVKISILI